MLCIYHVADHDGKGSGAVIRSVFPQAKFLGLNHDMPVPVAEIEKHDEIVICDFALPMDYMFDLNKRKNLTWIDHHVSAIEEYEKGLQAGQEPIKGLRKVGQAAIELCWQYFYPERKVPLGVELLAKNDLFDLRDERVRPFEYAMQSMGVNRPEDEIWVQLLNDELDIEKMVDEGRRILNWINVRNYRLVHCMAFESEVDGLKCICANMPQGYSSFYDSIPDKEQYDVMINFYISNKEKGHGKKKR